MADPPADEAVPPPFDGWTQHVRLPAVGYAWYLEPAVVVAYASVERANLAFANAIHDFIDAALAYSVTTPSYAEAGGMLFIHDWRRVSGYDPDARRQFLARMKQRREAYSRNSVMIVQNNPLIRMAIQGANLVAALRGSGRVTFAETPEQALKDHGIAAPTGPLPFPWPVTTST